MSKVLVITTSLVYRSPIVQNLTLHVVLAKSIRLVLGISLADFNLALVQFYLIWLISIWP